MFSPCNKLVIRLKRFLRTVGVFALTSSIVAIVGFGQTSQQKNDRGKTFGQSLKRFENKSDKKETKPKSAPANDDVIRVETNMVVTDALVVNPKGNAIVGLKKEDFIVTENGVPQEMELFENGETSKIPRSVVFIVEVGVIPSMADQSLEAAKTLVDKLAPNDRMAIVNTNTELVLDFTSDKKVLRSTLQRLKAESMGGRHNYSSLLASLIELFGPDDIKPIVINQSYGDELGALKPMWEFGKAYCNKGVRGFCERSFSFSDLVEAVERFRATIYSVIPGPQFVGRTKEKQILLARSYLSGYMDEIGNWERQTEREKEEFRKKWTDIEIFSHVETQKAIIKVTGLSGGVTNFLERPEDAEDIYGSIFRMIENRYTIGYYPKAETQDGTRRVVKIEVKGHPEYTILGRKIYSAPAR